MNKLAINTSESTKKKKKAKIDFVIDPKKASTSTVDNNELPKAKVFKNPPKLEPPEIVQKSEPYCVVKDLIETPVHIIFGQLMTHLQFRKNLHKLLIPKKKIPKTNKWLKKAKALLDYELCKLIIRCDEKPINQEEKQSDESDDDESDDNED
ncbi:hypothetical protein G9A89_018662 [Geosiphon pyriformis]|nr:hypothetical protein G9A89_018662 [Geosiphon pyriformis]